MKFIDSIILDTNWCQVKIFQDDDEEGYFYCIKGYGRGCFWSSPESITWTKDIDEAISSFYEQYGKRTAEE